MKQFILPELSNNKNLFSLKGEDFHYLVRVKRLEKGSRFKGLDSMGQNWMLQVESIHIDEIVIKKINLLTSENMQNSPQINLCPFLLKGKKLETVLRQSTEIGVNKIIPVLGEHCVSRVESNNDKTKKIQRWNKIIQEAVQQSNSPQVPQLEEIIPFKELKKLAAEGQLVLFFHEKPLAKEGLGGYLSLDHEEVTIVVGPEGGFSPVEVEQMLDWGFKPAYLGDQVLRAETASIVALGIVNYLVKETWNWKHKSKSNE